MPQARDNRIPYNGPRRRPRAPEDAAQRIAAIVRTDLPRNGSTFRATTSRVARPNDGARSETRWSIAPWLVGSGLVAVIIGTLLGVSSVLQSRAPAPSAVTASLPTESSPVRTVSASATPSPSPAVIERSRAAAPALPPAYVAPSIDSVYFPATMRADGSRTHGMVHFHDDNGDVVQASFRAISGNFSPSSYDPQVRGQRQGEFGFALWCNSPTPVTMLVSLQDAEGHLSGSKAFSFECVGASAAPSAPSLSGTINRFTTDRSSYKVNDPISISFYLAHDSYVYLFDHDTSGRWTLIFPSAYDSNNGLAAGYHTLPRPGSSSWKVTGPTGEEDLYLVTVDAPLAYVPQPPPGAGLVDLLGWFLKRLASSQWDYATASFTVRSY